MKLRLLLIIMCFAISLIPIAVISGLQNFQIATAFLALILAITLTVGYIIAHFISRPLVKLTKNIDEISKGNLDVELEDSEIYEINNLTVSLDRVMASLKLAIYKVGLKKEEIFQEVIKEKVEVEQKLEYLLRKIEGWIWETDETGICEVCSEKIIDVLGYTPQQIIGKNINEFLPTERAGLLHDLAGHIAQGKQNEVVSMDFPWLHNDDHHLVWIRSFFLPMVDKNNTFRGLRCYSRDVTELHNARERIKQLQTQLHQGEQCTEQVAQVLQYQPSAQGYVAQDTAQKEFDYMFLCDEHGKIIDCTIEAQQALGYTKKEILSLSVADINILETLEKIRALLGALKTKGCTDVKSVHRRKNGSSLLVCEHIRYLSDGNRFLYQVKEERK
ncbi:MAG TPA: PAS domain S-box protein [Candidatus Thermoplasmatota archaeon]|nr:PAS domain S-box protein [Candidatus Thermoplasmatota archaeon]